MIPHRHPEASELPATRDKQMDLWMVLIALLVLFGGGGGFYWGWAAGWGIGPIGLMSATSVAALLLNAYRGLRASPARTTSDW